MSQDDTARKLKMVSVNMSMDQMRQCSEGIIDEINIAQKEKGFTIDEVIISLLFVVGGTIAQRGGVLYTDKPLREALPPLVDGYLAAKNNQESDSPATDAQHNKLNS